MAIYPKMNLPQLRTATRQRADMVNSTFVTDDELNSYINASYFELYDLLVQKYGNDYFVKEYTFQLQGNVSRYDLPEDFFKLLGVDLQISSGPDGYVSLRPFTLAERNRYSTANVQTWIGVTNLRYRMSGNTLWFTPSPQTGQTIRIWYIPRLKELVDPITPPDVTLAAPNLYQRTLTFASNPSPGASVGIGGSTYTAVSGTPGVLQFQVGITAAQTASNLKAAATTFGGTILDSGTGVLTFYNNVAIVLSSSVPTVIVVGTLKNIIANVTLQHNAVVGNWVQLGSVLFNCIYPDTEPGPLEFQRASNISGTVLNIVESIQSYASETGISLDAHVSQSNPNSFQLFDVAGQNYYVSTIIPQSIVSMYGTGTLSSPVIYPSDTIADGISGWLEYVVTDAAIKMMQKEESDTSVLQLQKQALIKRIEAAAENRDAGSPATIADVQWTNGTWPFGNGFGGGGGIP